MANNEFNPYQNLVFSTAPKKGAQSNLQDPRKALLERLQQLQREDPRRARDEGLASKIALLSFGKNVPLHDGPEEKGIRVRAGHGTPLIEAHSIPEHLLDEFAPIIGDQPHLVRAIATAHENGVSLPTIRDIVGSDLAFGKGVHYLNYVAVARSGVHVLTREEAACLAACFDHQPQEHEIQDAIRDNFGDRLAFLKIVKDELQLKGLPQPFATIFSAELMFQLFIKNNDERGLAKFVSDNPSFNLWKLAAMAGGLRVGIAIEVHSLLSKKGRDETLAQVSSLVSRSFESMRAIHHTAPKPKQKKPKEACKNAQEQKRTLDFGSAQALLLQKGLEPPTVEKLLLSFKINGKFHIGSLRASERTIWMRAQASGVQKVEFEKTLRALKGAGIVSEDGRGGLSLNVNVQKISPGFEEIAKAVLEARN